MPRVRFRIDLAPGCAIGPGKIDLLEHIENEGSLSAAARRMGMSYRRAWLLLVALNDAFREPVADTSVGGRGGGGAVVTDFGRRLVRDYRRFEAQVGRLAARRWAPYATAARSAPPAPARPNKPARRSAAGRPRTRPPKRAR